MANGNPDIAARKESDAPARHRAGGGFLLLRRLWPLALVGAGIAGFFALGLDSYVTLESLKANREWLLTQVAEHRLATIATFILAYAAIAALSLPGAAIASVTGGFLFGLWFGTLFNVVAATTGAVLIFLAARTVLADTLQRRAGPWLQNVEAGFQKNAFNYLLFLRLVPGFPFFVVNLVPAFLGMRLRSFALATFIGIIPGGFVYTSVGVALGSVLAVGGDFTIDSVLTPQVFAPLIGLALLSLVPVLYRMWRTGRD